MASGNHILYLDSFYSKEQLQSKSYKLITPNDHNEESANAFLQYSNNTFLSKNSQSEIGFNSNDFNNKEKQSKSNNKKCKKIRSSNPVFIYSVLNFLYRKKVQNWKQLEVQNEPLNILLQQNKTNLDAQTTQKQKENIEKGKVKTDFIQNNEQNQLKLKQQPDLIENLQKERKQKLPQFQITIQNQNYFQLFEQFSSKIVIQQLTKIEQMFSQNEFLSDQFYQNSLKRQKHSENFQHKFKKNKQQNVQNVLNIQSLNIMAKQNFQQNNTVKKLPIFNFSLIDSLQSRIKLVNQMITQYLNYSQYLKLVICVIQPNPTDSSKKQQMKQDQNKLLKHKYNNIHYYVLYYEDQEEQKISYKLSNFRFIQVAIGLITNKSDKNKKKFNKQKEKQIVQKEQNNNIIKQKSCFSVKDQVEYSSLSFNYKQSIEDEKTEHKQEDTFKQRQQKNNYKKQISQNKVQKQNKENKKKATLQKSKEKITINKNQTLQNIMQLLDEDEQQQIPKYVKTSNQQKINSKDKQKTSNVFKSFQSIDDPINFNFQTDFQMNFHNQNDEDAQEQEDYFFTQEQSTIHIKNHQNVDQLKKQISEQFNHQIYNSKDKNSLNSNNNNLSFQINSSQSSSLYQSYNEISCTTDLNEQFQQELNYQNLEKMNHLVDSELYIIQKVTLIQKIIRFTHSNLYGKINFILEKLNRKSTNYKSIFSATKAKEVLFIFGHSEQLNYYYQTIMQRLKRIRCRKYSIFHSYFQNSFWLSILENLYKSNNLLLFINHDHIIIFYDEFQQAFMNYQEYICSNTKRLPEKLLSYQQSFIDFKQYQRIKEKFSKNLSFFEEYLQQKEYLYFKREESLDWRLSSQRKAIMAKKKYKNVPSYMACPQNMIIRGDKKQLQKLLKFKISPQYESKAIKQQPKIHQNSSRILQNKEKQTKTISIGDVSLSNENLQQFIQSVSCMKISQFQPINISLKLHIRLMNYASKVQKIYIVFNQFHQLVYLTAMIIDAKIQLRKILQLRESQNLFRRKINYQFTKDIYMWRIQNPTEWDFFINHLNTVPQFSKTVILKNRDFYQILSRKEKLKTVISVCVDFHSFNILLIENNISTINTSDNRKSEIRLNKQKKLAQQILNNPEKYMIYEFGQYQIDPISCYNIARLQQEYIKAFKQNQAILSHIRKNLEYQVEIGYNQNEVPIIDEDYQKNMYFELLMPQNVNQFKKIQIICFPFHKQVYFIQKHSEEIDGQIFKKIRFNRTFQKAFLQTPIDQKFFARYKESMMKKNISFFYFVLPHKSTEQIKIFDYKNLYNKIKKKKLISFSLTDYIKIPHWNFELNEIKYQIQLNKNCKLSKKFESNYEFSFSDEELKKFVANLQVVQQKIEKYRQFPGGIVPTKRLKSQQKFQKLGIKCSRHIWLQILKKASQILNKKYMEYKRKQRLIQSENRNQK